MEKKSKRYMTKKRKNKISQRKSLVMLFVIIIATAAIGRISVLADKEISNLIPQEPIVLTKTKTNIVFITKNETYLSVEEQIRKIAKDSNFKWPNYLVSLAKCESSLNPFAIGDNGHSRGLFQIHDKYHPEISTEQAMNIEFSTNWTIDMIEAGKQNQWSCNEKI